MIQKNKYITLRYITNEIAPKNVTKKINKPSAPTREKNDSIATWRAKQQQHILELDKYKEQLREPVFIKNMTIKNEENLSNKIRFFANSIKYNFELGNSTFLGLKSAEEINWYIKPIKITIEGVSVVSPNIFLDSDNVILTLYNKLKDKLGENNYNYFKSTKFHLVIENGLNDLNDFYGIITSLSFGEEAKKPDTYDYTLKFVGKPYIGNKQKDAIENKEETDNVTNNVPKKSNIEKVNNQKI